MVIKIFSCWESSLVNFPLFSKITRLCLRKLGSGFKLERLVGLVFSYLFSRGNKLLLSNRFGESRKVDLLCSILFLCRIQVTVLKYLRNPSYVLGFDIQLLLLVACFHKSHRRRWEFIFRGLGFRSRLSDQIKWPLI